MVSNEQHKTFQSKGIENNNLVSCEHISFHVQLKYILLDMSDFIHKQLSSYEKKNVGFVLNNSSNKILVLTFRNFLILKNHILGQTDGENAQE